METLGVGRDREGVDVTRIEVELVVHAALEEARAEAGKVVDRQRLGGMVVGSRADMLRRATVDELLRSLARRGAEVVIR